MLQWSWSNRTLALDPERPVLNLTVVGAAEAFQALASLSVDAIADAARLAFPVLHRREPRREFPGADLRHLLSGGAPDGCVRGDEADPLSVPVLGGKALEEGIGVAGETHVQCSEARVGPDPVEDHDASSSADCDEARERVDQLIPFLQPRGAQQVVSVEQVEGGIRHFCVCELRRRAALRRR